MLLCSDVGDTLIAAIKAARQLMKHAMANDDLITAIVKNMQQ